MIRMRIHRRVVALIMAVCSGSPAALPNPYFGIEVVDELCFGILPFFGELAHVAVSSQHRSKYLKVFWCDQPQRLKHRLLPGE
jgi:hypothetical protein